jgi:hypothetical protein
MNTNNFVAANDNNKPLGISSTVSHHLEKLTVSAVRKPVASRISRLSLEFTTETLRNGKTGCEEKKRFLQTIQPHPFKPDHHHRRLV